MSYLRKLALVFACTAALCGCSGNSSSSSGTPAVAISPGTVNFGTIVVGTKSSPQTVTVGNSGEAPLTLSSIKLTGASASLFTLNNTCGANLQPGAVCDLQVTLLPTSPGTATASLVLSDNAPNSPQTVSVNGTAVTPASASVSASTLSFGNLVVGTASAAQTVTLTNTGGTALTISNLGLTGSGASSFSQANTCGVSLAGGSTCNIQVAFTPTSAVPLSATLTIEDDSANSPQTVQLSGTGITPPAASISPQSLNFGSVILGTQGTAQTVTITNTGAAPLAIKGLLITGTNAALFSESSTCSSIIAGGASCSASVNFQPTAAGQASASLSISDSASNSPQTVALTGAGINPGSTSITPLSLSFGTVVIGTVSSPQTVALTNAGGAPLTIGSIQLTGTGGTSFALANSCGASLAAGATCNIQVTFDPTAAATASASLTFVDDSATSPQSVALSGTGIKPPAVTISPLTLNFGNVVIGTQGTAQTVTITNTGGAPLTMNGVTLAGANTTLFSDSSTCPSVLATGASCNLAVSFLPSAAGQATASLTVADSAWNSPQTVALTGAGITPGSTSVTPISMSFGNVAVGTQSASQTVALTNAGGAPLTISSLGLTGTGASSFSESNNCSSTLAAGATCNIGVTFIPTAATAVTASLTVLDNSANSPKSVALSGTGITAPAASISPLTLNLGNVVTGMSSTPQAVTITNTGQAPLVIGAVSFTGTDPALFSEANGCTAPLAGGATCTLTVSFVPTAAGQATASLTIADNAANSPQTISLSGTGISPAAISINPLSLSFGNVLTGTQSTAQTITLANTGGAALTIGSIQVAGAGASLFSLTNSCGATLAQGATCSVGVTFAPTAGTSIGASLVITDNSAKSPQTVPLSGTGITPATASLSPPSLNFGSIVIGTNVTAQTVTVTNTGESPLTISGVSLAGANASLFSDTSTCGSTVAAGASCQLTVSFVPTASGPAAAALLLTDNGANSPQSIPLAGAGIAPALLTITPPNVGFGNVLIGSQSTQQTVTLTNSGGAALTIGSIQLTGTGASLFSLTNSCGSTLASGATCSVAVIFNPIAAAFASASLNIVDSSANSPQAVALSGTGITPAAASVSPSSLNFGNVVIGMPGTAQTVTITNTGGAPLTINTVAATGAKASLFSDLNSCGSVLAGGASCELLVNFQPTAAGPATASLTIADSAANAPQTIALSGTGITPAALTVTPPSVSFGSVLLGTPATPQTVTLTNSGDATLTIAGIQLTAAATSAFTTSNTCSSSLAGGAACTIQIGFQPTLTGPASASINIADSAANSPQAIALTGTGALTLPASVVVYGATPSGIAAAIEAAQMGKQVTLIEPSLHVGGMMSSGLGFSDTYHSAAIGGFASQFFQNVNTYYAGSPSTNGGLYFEPHVAEAVFNSMLAQHANITVVLGASFVSVQMTGTTITGLTASNGVTYQGGEYIDASYTGDLMAGANVSYVVGRESSSQYNELAAGVGVPWQFGTNPIDPYITPGDPSSGLIAHVESDDLPAPGSADNTVMAYNYRLCITFDQANKIPVPVPADYDPAEFEILGRLATAANPPMPFSNFFATNQLPNGKLDMNQRGFFSTDEVGESNGYPDGSATQRAQIEAEQRRFILALIHFVQTDPRIPSSAQQIANAIGLCKDEFTDNGGWPRQIYVREARRMVGAYVLTQSDLNLQTTVPDSIGVGGFTIDDHYHHIVNINGEIYLENDLGDTPSLYPISYRILTPVASQTSNLLVTVDSSSSHLAYDSMRIETTYMILGQAAGAAASLAVDAQEAVQSVDYGALSSQLLQDGAILTPP